MSFILGYFQQKVMTKFYENLRILHFGPFFPRLRTIIHLENTLSSLLTVSRFLLLCRILVTADEHIARKVCCRQMDGRTERLTHGQA